LNLNPQKSLIVL